MGQLAKSKSRHERVKEMVTGDANEAQLIVLPDGTICEDQVEEETTKAKPKSKGKGKAKAKSKATSEAEVIDVDWANATPDERIKVLQDARAHKHNQLLVLKRVKKSIEDELKVFDEKIMSCMTEKEMPMIQTMMEWVSA